MPRDAKVTRFTKYNRSSIGKTHKQLYAASHRGHVAKR